MNILLDTNVFIWMQEGNERLPVTWRSIIENAAYTKFISIVSLWEIAVKTNIGKLAFSIPITEVVPNEIEIIPIELTNLVCVQNLPLYHRDPFDRLIIAQAMERELLIMSADERFQEYAVSLVP